MKAAVVPAANALTQASHARTHAQGYFGDKRMTDDNFRDLHGDGHRWFNTGDIVEYDRRLETLKPIDRLKNFVKLANSVFVRCVLLL
jgi:long-subunit acyl-CoA synthetase (AMP-forming)